MKLKHYPELRKGIDASVELDESPLLSSTARRVWKDCGPIKIRQLGACFFFEFEDEESKNKVLEGGPYFFSKRYLVLKEWERMLAPTTEHPSTIPTWVKIHKLPLECWTEEGLSRIASTIGGLNVDVATAKQQKIAFARVCIEVEAESDLPSYIQVTTARGSVVVTVEYQWLPQKCSKCKVFDHSCYTKSTTTDPEASNTSTSGKRDKPKDAWQTVGRVDSRAPTTEAFSILDTSGNAQTPQLLHCSDNDDSTDEELIVEETLPHNGILSTVCPPLVEQTELPLEATHPSDLAAGTLSQHLGSLEKQSGIDLMDPHSTKPPDPPDSYGKSGKKKNKKNYQAA